MPLTIPDPLIQVILNDTQTQLVEDGWAACKTAQAFQGAIKSTVEEVVGEELEELIRYLPAELGFDYEGAPSLGVEIDSPNLWQEPETGVITQRISFLRSDLMENAALAPYWMGLDQFHYWSGDANYGPDLYEQVQTDLASQPKRISTQRASAEDALVGLYKMNAGDDLDPPEAPLRLPLPAELRGFDIKTKYGLRWVMRSKNPLFLNEAFGVHVQTYGIETDRADVLMALFWGNKWFYLLRMNGQSEFFELKGYRTISSIRYPVFIKRARFEVSQGGVDHKQPFQLGIIPWGIDCISFTFSQAPQGKSKQAAAYQAGNSAGYLYQCRKHDFTPHWDAARSQFVKYPAAPLYIAFRETNYQIDVAVSRGRYESTGCGLILAPEVLDKPRALGSPEVYPIGYFGQRHTGTPADVFRDKGSAIPGAQRFNWDGTVWVPAEDTKLVAKCWLKPDQFGLYSAEIWAMDYGIPASYSAPSWDTKDLSTKWRKIEGRLSVHPDINPCTILYDRSADYAELLKLDGPVLFQYDDIKVHEGAVDAHRTVSEGGYNPTLIGTEPKSNIMFTDDLDVADFWDRANRTKLEGFTYLNGRSFGLLYEIGLKRMGYPPAERDISSELYELLVGGWESPNDWKMLNEDASAGDLFRTLHSLYGAQATAGFRELRCYRYNGVVSAYLSPMYDPAVVPTKVIYWDSACLPAGGPYDDEERWSGIEGTTYVKAFQKFEPVVQRAAGNAINAKVPTGASVGVDSYAAYVAAHSEVLNDPEFVDFEGSLKTISFGPPETGLATTLIELAAMARRKYDKDCRHQRSRSPHIEWFPGLLDLDDFIMVIGKAPRDTETVLKGDNVSYGAFLLEDIQYRFLRDDSGATISSHTLGGSKNRSRKFTGEADVQLTYVGETDSEDYPMFTDITPLYGRVEESEDVDE